jgi:hypothetical protein
MSTPWSEIADSIERFYEEVGVGHEFSEDNVYLREAYEFTEELWSQQLEGMDRVNIVVLSEAPLYGDARSYIYNPDTQHTAFLYANDLPDVEQSDSSAVSGGSPKLEQIHRLRELGVLVLDLFPLALNAKKTALAYRSTADIAESVRACRPLRSSEYRRLFEICCGLYLVPPTPDPPVAAMSNPSSTGDHSVLRIRHRMAV